ILDAFLDVEIAVIDLAMDIPEPADGQHQFLFTHQADLVQHFHVGDGSPYIEYGKTQVQLLVPADGEFLYFACVLGILLPEFHLFRVKRAVTTGLCSTWCARCRCRVCRWNGT